MRTAIFAVVSALLPTCAYAVTELVMREGVTIEARKDNTSIKITSGKGFDRTYEWDRCKLKSDMGARTQRWYGSMGIYDPSPSSSASGGGCSGISRTVVQEGQIHFDDMQFALKWIERQPDKTVWTNDGLLVSWDIKPGRRQLNVDVWLMCINGKRPKQLVGAIDSAISISPAATGKGIHECAQVGRDVTDQTRVQFEADWKLFDEYRERRQRSKQSSSPDWISDSKTGCKAWNSSPGPGETITWSGDCKNGLAQGQGVLQWYKDGKPGSRFEGEYKDGKMNGRGVLTLGSGGRYKGEFKDGKPNGIGSLVSGGETFSGSWNKGCLRQGNEGFWIGTTREECGFD